MNRRGITLMELIIVMAIIALGAVLMVPNIAGWIPNYRLRSATRDVVSTLRVAQMKAVARNMDHRVIQEHRIMSLFPSLKHFTVVGCYDYIAVIKNTIFLQGIHQFTKFPIERSDIFIICAAMC